MKTSTRLWWFIGLLTMLATTTTSLAQDHARFRDGGIVRGRVIEWRPGENLVIESEAGTIVRVPASEVEEVVLGGQDVGAAGHEDAGEQDHVSTSEEASGDAAVPESLWISANAGLPPTRAIRWADGSVADACMVPCALVSPDTLIELRISFGEGGPRRPEHHTFSIAETSEVLVEYEDRSTTRVVGAVLVTILATLSLGFGVGGVFGNVVNPGSGDLYLSLASPIAGALAFVVGLPALAQRDHLDLVAAR